MFKIINVKIEENCSIRTIIFPDSDLVRFWIGKSYRSSRQELLARQAMASHRAKTEKKSKFLNKSRKSHSFSYSSKKHKT